MGVSSSGQSIVERPEWKYREGAYRYIYMDVGHIGQNLYFVANALGLGCFTVGAFFDKRWIVSLAQMGRKKYRSTLVQLVGFDENAKSWAGQEETYSNHHRRRVNHRVPFAYFQGEC